MIRFTKVWDKPVRIFTALLAVFLTVSIVTAIKGGALAAKIHVLSGYVLAVLVTFRIIWGFIGSKTARFTDMIKNPKEITAQIIRPRNDKKWVGHSPLAGLGVTALLLVLAATAFTGMQTIAGGAGVSAHAVLGSLTAVIAGALAITALFGTLFAGKTLWSQITGYKWTNAQAKDLRSPKPYALAYSTVASLALVVILAGNISPVPSHAPEMVAEIESPAQIEPAAGETPPELSIQFENKTFTIDDPLTVK